MYLLTIKFEVGAAGGADEGKIVLKPGAYQVHSWLGIVEWRFKPCNMRYLLIIEFEVDAAGGADEGVVVAPMDAATVHQHAVQAVQVADLGVCV